MQDKQVLAMMNISIDNKHTGQTYISHYCIFEINVHIMCPLYSEKLLKKRILGKCMPFESVTWFRGFQRNNLIYVYGC